MTLTQKAFAKVNLSLDVIGKMADGYHSLKTVMQTVSLSDEVTIAIGHGGDVDKRGGEADKRGGEADRRGGEADGRGAFDDAQGAGERSGAAGGMAAGCMAAGGNSVTVSTGVSYIPGDERNTAATAAAAFFRHTGIGGCLVDIRINKQIPICAGLGGGSADAACVLRMLNEMLGTGLGRGELEKIALDVGSDVPFCVSGGTKLAEGRGEILTGLPPIPECGILICKPGFHNSTPELFRRIDCKKIRTRPDTGGLVAAIARGDLQAMAKRMYNVFEDFLPKRCGDIELIKELLYENGALGAVMTGSGSAVFGVFESLKAAEAAYSGTVQSGLGDWYLAYSLGSAHDSMTEV